MENRRYMPESYRSRKAICVSRPPKGIAVLARMDAMDVHKILGLEEVEAHVIRNADG